MPTTQTVWENWCLPELFETKLKTVMLNFCLLNAFDILSFFDPCDFKIYTSFNNLEIA